MKIKIYLVVLLMIVVFAGCADNTVEPDTSEDNSTNEYSDLLDYKEALEIFKENVEAEILDIETNTTFRVRRVTGGFNTLADVETLTVEDTNKLLETTDGEWNATRRAVIVIIDDIRIPASITIFQHSGSEDYLFGEIIDNRSGSTGTGVNLDSIRGNGLIGVVDVFFYNSLVPGVARTDERHQEMVLKAYEYEK